MSTGEAIEIGYWLSSEEHGPRALADVAVRAEASGFRHVMISDHFHPWLPSQGHSPFVWGVIGAIAHATTDLHVATGVTAPISRMHPAIVAHAAATAAVQLEGRFALGLGSGERLNEHVTGQRWPSPAERRAMLREAIDIIRRLFDGGPVSTRGDWFRVDHAQLFTRPEIPPPIWVAAGGPRSAQLAGEMADGLISVAPEPRIAEAFRSAGGEGPRVAQLHVCWAADEEAARRTIARWWPNGALPARLNTELERPADFADACALVTEDAAARSVVHGPDPEPFASAALRFVTAGYERVYVHQIGPDQPGFIDFWQRRVAPLIG